MTAKDKITEYVCTCATDVKATVCVLEKPRNLRCFCIENPLVLYLSL